MSVGYTSLKTREEIQKQLDVLNKKNASKQYQKHAHAVDADFNSVMETVPLSAVDQETQRLAKSMTTAETPESWKSDS